MQFYTSINYLNFLFLFLLLYQVILISIRALLFTRNRGENRRPSAHARTFQSA